jgi:hypothetical protein
MPISDVRQVIISSTKQLAQNVWKATVAGQHYAIKLEKKTFLRMAGHPDNRDGWEMRLTDLTWATNLFLEICKNDRLHPWSRPLGGEELAFVWGSLPGNNVARTQLPSTLATITDFVPDHVDFSKCDQGKSHVCLNALLTGKGDPVSLHTLGRGLAVDLFLGNNDRYAYESTDGSIFVNLENFFLHVNPSGPNSIFYIDFWDPNSAYNSKNKFPTTIGPEYLGSLLSNDQGRMRCAQAISTRLSKLLKIQNVNVKGIAEGLKSGAADLGKFLRKDKNHPHISRRLVACGIKP